MTSDPKTRADEARRVANGSAPHTWNQVHDLLSALAADVDAMAGRIAELEGERDALVEWCEQESFDKLRSTNDALRVDKAALLRERDAMKGEVTILRQVLRGHESLGQSYESHIRDFAAWAGTNLSAATDKFKNGHHVSAADAGWRAGYLACAQDTADACERHLAALAAARGEG